jgi:hypothetical protein
VATASIALCTFSGSGLRRLWSCTPMLVKRPLGRSGANSA